jgi:putative iron-dependent peroxidase
VVAIGPSLAQALDADIPGLRDFPVLQGVAPAQSVSTPSALCLWLRGEERGELLLRTRRLAQLLAPALTVGTSWTRSATATAPMATAAI